MTFVSVAKAVWLRLKSSYGPLAARAEKLTKLTDGRRANCGVNGSVGWTSGELAGLIVPSMRLMIAPYEKSYPPSSRNVGENEYDTCATQVVPGDFVWLVAAPGTKLFGPKMPNGSTVGIVSCM